MGKYIKLLRSKEGLNNDDSLMCSVLYSWGNEEAAGLAILSAWKGIAESWDGLYGIKYEQENMSPHLVVISKK